MPWFRNVEFVPNEKFNKEIQKYLNRALSLSLDADGIFGKMTEAALAKFQAQKGISPAIGIFGKITREYINAHPLSN